jgi:hypothetical protein
VQGKSRSYAGGGAIPREPVDASAAATRCVWRVPGQSEHAPTLCRQILPICGNQDSVVSGRSLRRPEIFFKWTSVNA